jgi:hypothetical protein
MKQDTCVWIAALLVAAAWSVAPASAAVIVDDFTDTKVVWPVTDTTMGGTVPAIDGSALNPVTGVVGGVRNGFLNLTTKAYSYSAIKASVVPADGQLVYESNTGAGGTFAISFTISSVDLTGLDAIAIDFVQLDLGAGLPFTVRYSVLDGINALRPQQNMQPGEMLAGGTLVLPFAPILASESPTTLSLVFDAPGPADFAISEIRVVPEPASIVLLLAGGAAMLGRKRLPARRG